jgi:hypothetical protein
LVSVGSQLPLDKSNLIRLANPYKERKVENKANVNRAIRNKLSVYGSAWE